MDVTGQLRSRRIGRPQVPVSEYGSGFWRSVIWWQPAGSGQLARPVGEFHKPIRNRAESVELHFRRSTIWQGKLASEKRMERALSRFGIPAQRHHKSYPTRSLLIAGLDRNRLDFEACTEEQRAGTDEGAGWEWRVEIGAINLVEGVEER